MKSGLRAVLTLILPILAGCETASAWSEDTPRQCRVRTGEADIACTVAANGEVSDCRVISETPAGCGFGPAALDAAATARMTPREGSQGGEVNFTVRFGAPHPRP